MSTAPSATADDRRVECPSFDPNLLVTMWHIETQGSLSAAARALGWSQPAISQQVRKLERDCGCALLEREGRGVKLTAAGMILAKHGELIALRLAQAGKEFDEYRRRADTTLRLLAPPSICSTIVSKALAKLSVDSPIDVSLAQAEPPEAIEAVTQGTADCAMIFRYDSIPQYLVINDDELAFDDLGDDPLLLLMKSSFASARRFRENGTPVKLRTFAPCNWIAGCPFCQTNLLSMAAREDFKPNITYCVDDYATTQNLVAIGENVSIVSRLASMAPLPANLTLCPIDDPYARRSVGIITRRGDARPAVRTLCDELRWAAGPLLEH
ncbi:LysR family transcriptional regulator [Bifidobacterium simiiventris]|uniref:LysR family transcriptional regulator n=1 Tax=Bifidobacterium simiiventris TaxID=2834434 RepID=UPI001C55C03D|nr:LysR family transcriptional regulator [Bifidobacterium simiiventris]MBW3079390.1 LysR family transcriptional regulator [Bifidobacterium simiiventris]